MAVNGDCRRSSLPCYGHSTAAASAAQTETCSAAHVGSKWQLMEKLRIDKWLWAARFYKTRSLAVEEINKGRVHVNDQEAKPAREVKVGDTVMLRQGPVTRTLRVRGISSQRGAAPVAQHL